MAGYGADIWCTDQLITGRLARGPAVVAQALYRRLITPRGTLRGGDDESAYGFDVASYVGAVGTATALAALPGLVRGELVKDARVADVAATASITTDPGGLVSIVIVVDVTLADEGETFTFSVGVDAVSAQFLGLGEAA